MGEKKRNASGTRFWKYEGFLQKGILFALSFFVPLIVMLAVFISRDFYPFGDKTLFIMDMKGQYVEFFASLRYLFRGDDSLFFSWSRSMGGNFLGLFAYYVASPLSFLTVFFPLEKLTVGILLLTLIKIGLCGLSFAWYASWLWKEYAEEDGNRWSCLLILIFSVSYALISYNMVYSLCLMWLDGVILLPMVLLGVEKILKGDRGLHYTLALAAIFICNYYTGYMVGIFTAIYMVYRVICLVNREQVKIYLQRTLRFTCATFLAFGLSAPLILPVVKDLMQGKLASAKYMPDTKVNFEFAGLFGKLKNGVYDSITNTGLPAIYCGYLILALLLIFFFLRKISIREKVGAVLILGILGCSLYYTKLDIAWHGFQYPTWFPYRYAFLVSFFMIYMAFRSGCRLWAVLSQKSQTWKKGARGPLLPVCITVVLVGVIGVELGINGKALLTGLENEFGYDMQQDYEAFLQKEKPLTDQIAKEDQSFYRINAAFEYSKNDAMLFGYRGMTHYSSTFHAAVNSLTPKLGIAQSHIWNSGYGSNAMLDSLFAVKYILEDGGVPSSYEAAGSGAGAAAYRNPHALSIAYSAPMVGTEPNVETGDPFQNQNAFLNMIAGTETAYFTELPYTIDQPDHTWSYTFTADSDNPVYLYMRPNSNSWADVFVNDSWVGNYFSTETVCSLYLGNFQEGEQVTVRVVPSSPVSVNFAAIGELHMELLEPTLEQLRQGNLEITDHRSGKLSGKITVGENQTIMTSIPYDSGWTVKVDGKKAEVGKYADTFLTVQAEPGEHEISFSYVSPGFGMGMVLFAAAVIVIVVVLCWNRIGKDNKSKQ